MREIFEDFTMAMELLAGLALFAFVSSITPGPNNVMLMASGATHGVRASIPHLLGVGIGFMVMLVLVGLGISEIFIRYPLSLDALRVVSVVYLGYLALSLARARTTAGSGQAAARPLTFLQAALFQWVNPKGWAMALTAVTAYAPSHGVGVILVIAAVFAMINLPSVGVWVVLGQKMSRWLTSERRIRRFNTGMAVLLMVSLLPLLG